MKEILLTRGLVAQIDDEDYALLSRWKWCATQDRSILYAVRNIREGGKRKTIQMHRVILNAPIGVDVDHRDGNGLNNTRSNIRLCSRGQNLHNMRGHQNVTSKHKGVHWSKERGKWKAQIAINGRILHLGYYSNEGEAALAYNWVAMRYYGEFARLNNVEATT